MREFAFGAASVTLGAFPLTSIRPAASISFNLVMLRHWIGFSANATSAQQRVQLYTQASVFPTMTTGSTPAPLKRHDAISSIVSGTASAAGTASITGTAQGAGTNSVIMESAFNHLTGYLEIPSPEERIVLPVGYASTFGMQFPATPGTLTGWSFGHNFAEV